MNNVGSNIRRLWKKSAVVLLVLAVALTLGSCRGSDSYVTPGPTSTPAPAPTSLPTPTTVPGPSANESIISSNLTPTLSPAAEPENLKVVSNLNIGAGPGNISDVWALTASSGRAYAYLGTYDGPFCSHNITGVHIVDITDPAKPVKAGFLSSPEGTRVGEFVMPKQLRTSVFTGDVLVHSVEFCRDVTPPPPESASAGIVLYDVTDPLAPRRLAADFSLGFQVHNGFVYQQGERAYVAVVRDFADRDFYIVEITNPASPVVISVRGWPDWFGADDQLALGVFPDAFLHDVWVQSYPANLSNPNYAGKTIAYLSYWDAGLVIVDITTPTNPIFLGDSNYMDPDPLTGQSPEGNSHSAVPTQDASLVFMGDEDFSASRPVLAVDTGDFAGQYNAVEANFTKSIRDLPGQNLTGQAIFVGSACDVASILPPPTVTPGIKYVALIERGGCPFEDIISNAAVKGYDGAIVFASADAPEQLIRMRGSPEKGTIPALFVARSAAFAILGISSQSPLPAIGTTGQQVTVKAVFDGWGYGRVLDVSDPKNVIELGQYATSEALTDPSPPGDHSMHNVIIREQTAYISWYNDGIRVVDFSNPAKPREVARFVDPEKGSNFWGVYLFQHPDGKLYILGSDRDSGLWVFEAPSNN